MKRIIILFLILSSYQLLSQSKKVIYVNENYKKISKKEYQKKLKSKLFDIATTVKDTVILKKLRFSEFYGQLEETKRKQIFKLFHKRFHLDTTKVWVIHYIDSVPDKKKMPLKSGLEFIDSKGKLTGIFLTQNEFKNSYGKYPYKRHRHRTSYSDYIKGLKTENNKYKNSKGIELIHLYKTNKGFPNEELKKHNYYKDKLSFFKKFFTDGLKLYTSVLIYPDGNFYASKFHYHNANFEKKLAKEKIYNRKKNKWLKKLKKS